MTLIFNTTEKTVEIYANYPNSNSPIETFNEVPTVKVREEGVYEVFQWKSGGTGGPGIDGRVYPVARYPIANTVMMIRN